MICPVLSSSYALRDSQLINCLGQECAWWNEQFGKCSITVDAGFQRGFELGRENAEGTYGEWHKPLSR